MAHPDHALWKEGWRANQTPFHLTYVHPLLMRFWAQMGVDKAEGVFVPLCGKSLDVMWLHDQGHQVVGVELSPIAVKALFKAAHLRPQRENYGDLIRWNHRQLTIFCGDFFAMTKADMLAVQVVYDRAALTALPENMREYYVAHLHAILPAECQILLLTVEDLDDEDTASDYMTQSTEISALYSEYFSIELLHAEYHEACMDELGQETAARCVHKAYRLQSMGQ